MKNGKCTKTEKSARVGKCRRQSSPEGANPTRPAKRKDWVRGTHKAQPQAYTYIQVSALCDRIVIRVVGYKSKST
jgi:hypothetical protein